MHWLHLSMVNYILKHPLLVPTISYACLKNFMRIPFSTNNMVNVLKYRTLLVVLALANSIITALILSKNKCNWLSSLTFPGVASSIPVRSHTFLGIDHEMIPPFRWFIQEGLLSVTSESMCTNYWLTTCSSLPRKKVRFGELTVPQWP